MEGTLGAPSVRKLQSLGSGRSVWTRKAVLCLYLSNYFITRYYCKCDKRYCGHLWSWSAGVWLS